MSKKKTAIAAVSVAAAATVIIGGTLAYLQDSKNASVDLVGGDHVLVNEINASVEDARIFPGKTVSFNPSFKVDTTADAYVFAEISGDASEYIDLNNTEAGWEELQDASTDSTVFYREVAGSDTEQELYIFNDGKITFSADLTNDTLPQSATINVKGYAIQKDYLPNEGNPVSKAWELASRQ